MTTEFEDTRTSDTSPVTRCCRLCGRTLVQRPHEYSNRFRFRQYCNEGCETADRRNRSQQARAEVCPYPEVEEAVLRQARQIEQELFQSLRAALADNRAISSLHWLLIKRACWHYSIISVRPDSINDKMLIELLADPLRVLRAPEQIRLVLETEVAQIIADTIPDPEERRAIASALTPTSS